MAIWIQSLSWALIYALGQGFIVYASLWLVLRLVPAASSTVRYHLSLSGLTILLAWFVATWWQQFQLSSAIQQSLIPQAQGAVALHLFAQPGYSSYHSIRLSMLPILPWLSAGYVIGLMLMLARLSAGMLQLLSLRRGSLSQPPAAVLHLLRSLKSRLHIYGPVQLFISARAQVPMVIGFLKPVILMPAAAMAQLTTQQLETILLHELAHIRRYDYLVNILQTIVETILFFNPFVWMISSITRREREHCCDDLVLAHTPEPLFYATALAALATHPAPVSTLVVASSGQSAHLLHRIRRVMELKKSSFSYSRMVAAILIISAITCSLAWLSPPISRSRQHKAVAARVTPPAPANKQATSTPDQETSHLVQRLIDDHLISESTGFTVIKAKNELYINGQKQAAELTHKYLQGIKQENIQVQVHAFGERLMQHPGASMLQIIAPIRFSSPCVSSSAKPGC